jgi:hypothetical protein
VPDLGPLTEGPGPTSSPGTLPAPRVACHCSPVGFDRQQPRCCTAAPRCRATPAGAPRWGKEASRLANPPLPSFPRAQIAHRRPVPPLAAGRHLRAPTPLRDNPIGFPITRATSWSRSKPNLRPESRFRVPPVKLRRAPPPEHRLRSPPPSRTALASWPLDLDPTD